MKTSIKKVLLALMVVPLLSIGFTSCDDDDDDDMVPPKNDNPVTPNPNDTTSKDTNSYAVTINMKQFANDIAVTLTTDTVKPYTNKKGQRFNISRLRYLISDVTFHMNDTTSIEIEGYHLVDVSDANTLTYSPNTKIKAGTYESISFTFGFDTTDNQANAYPDLNTANWNWPGMLGNGYHYMQLEGKYDSLGTEKFFATHMGKARNMSTTPTTFENNHFIARPANSSITVSGDFSFDIEMNVEQWYEDTFEWDFNVWNAPIMPIYDAQKRLNENGHSVFTVKM